MNKLNLIMFILVVMLMVAFAQYTMRGGGLEVYGRTIGNAYAGRPEVRPPFPRGSYNITLGDDGIKISLSGDISNEYEGNFLSVYAYDDGRHVVKFKRVINGEIFIKSDEEPSFIVEFNGDMVSKITKPKSNTLFQQIVRDAIDSGRNYGIGRCLLGKQGEKICPVYAIELVKDDNEFGRIKPLIARNKCIEDGLCIAVCPTGLLYRGE